MLSFYICALITSVSACTSLGFSVAAVRTTGGEIRTGALYAMARSLALAIVSFIPLAYHALPFLVGLAVVMVVVQAFDALIGLTIHNNLKTFGPAATALCNLLALMWLLD